MASTKVDYAKTGLEVLDAVGGEKNIRSLAHCATRLRFTLKDNSIPNKDAIQAISGVVTVMQAGQPLVTFDRNAVAAAGYQDTVITIITNSGSFSIIEPLTGKNLTAGELAVIVER